LSREVINNIKTDIFKVFHSSVFACPHTYDKKITLLC